MSPVGAGEAGFEWTNPVIRGCAPDPSVIRVGSDYFLATSTFEYLPGIRIFHSVDLANWTLLGGAIDRPAQYRRDGGPGAISLFAPVLRHHAGVFFLVCTNVTEGQGNFLLSATDPSGPWSDAVWLDVGGFDPSLFFDADGTCLYSRRTLDLSAPEDGLGPIVQAELTPDTGALGPLRPITAGRTGFCSNDIEGPHLFRRGDWYYLTAAEGGTWMGHMQTVARSRSPWGPFDPCPHNPVLTHRHRVMHPVQSLGHCDFVEDPSGGWWAVSLGTRHRGRHHLLGRETFLHAVEWRDDWPVLGVAGTAVVQGRSGRSPATKGRALARPASAAAAGWCWKGTDDVDALIDRDYVSFLAGAPFTSGDVGRIGALYRYQTEFDESVLVDLPSPDSGLCTGVAVVADATHYIALRLATEEGTPSLTLSRVADDLALTEVLDTALPVSVQVSTGPDGYLFVLVDAGGARLELGPFSSRLLSAEATEWFTGVKVALLAESEAPQRVQFKVQVQEAGIGRDDREVPDS